MILPFPNSIDHVTKYFKIRTLYKSIFQDILMQWCVSTFCVFNVRQIHSFRYWIITTKSFRYLIRVHSYYLHISISKGGKMFYKFIFVALIVQRLKIGSNSITFFWNDCFFYQQQSSWILFVCTCSHFNVHMVVNQQHGLSRERNESVF